MLCNEAEIDTLLSKIQERMARGKTLRLIGLNGDEQAYFREKNDKLWANRATHPIARSELLVSPDDLNSVEEQINTIRDWLFLTGLDYTHHEEFPKYQTNLADYNNRTPQEWRNLFFRPKDGIFSIHADRNPLLSQEEPGDRLYMGIDDPKRNIEFRFGFNSDFLLGVVFNIGGGYFNTSRLPLGEMTQEEYFIVNHFMSRYIKDVIK